MLRQNVNIRLQARLDSSRIRVTHASLYLDENHFALPQRYMFLPDQRFWSYWRLEKEMLKAAGIRVLKTRGHWCVDTSTVVRQLQQTPQSLPRESLPYFKSNDLRMHWQLDADFNARLASEAKK